MADLTPNHPSLEEVRRHWGLAVDIHRREERLAEFDRMIRSLKAEAWEEGWGVGMKDADSTVGFGTANPYRKADA